MYALCFFQLPRQFSSVVHWRLPCSPCHQCGQDSPAPHRSHLKTRDENDIIRFCFGFTRKPLPLRIVVSIQMTFAQYLTSDPKKACLQLVYPVSLRSPIVAGRPLYRVYIFQLDPKGVSYHTLPNPGLRYRNISEQSLCSMTNRRQFYVSQS